MKGQFTVVKTQANYSEYRHIEIRVRQDANSYSGSEVTITFQSDNNAGSFKDWYGMHLEVRAHDMTDMKYAAAIAKALTCDEYGSFYQTPAACIEALTKAGYKQAIWTEVFYGGGMRDVHFFTAGTYYGAYIPKWGFCYVPNSRTQGAAIAAITEQVLDRYGNKSLIASWASDGFPMTSIDVPEFDQANELDPNKFTR